MWIIYNRETGVEFDTYEHYIHAESKVVQLNGLEDYDIYEIRYEVR